MASKPTLKLIGEKELIRKLKRLGDKRKLKRVLRKGTNAAGQVLVKSVRAGWPTDTGLSKKSVDKKVISTKAGYMVIVGVDRNATGESHGRKHVPSKIDHLIEFGWQTEDGTTVPGQAPLRTGYGAAEADAKRRFIAKAAEEIEKEARKR